MGWQKQGRIFVPNGEYAWCQTHAALPVVEHLHDDIFRVYFSSRDAKNRAQIGYIVIDLNQPDKILDLSPEPVIQVGAAGLFDDSGVTSACIVAHDEKSYFYYSGWSLGVTVPFYFYIGAAVRPDSSSDDNTFEKLSRSPVLGRNDVDHYLTASPSIVIEDGLWRMWYTSCERWEMHNDSPRHYYHIRYAESRDGIHWQADGHVCIDFKDEHEYAIARPHVLKSDAGYEMWYSYRGDAYRIGYATSDDGLSWTRRDESAGIDVSESGWDSYMLAYPVIFEHKGRRHMFYNGNDYGKTGIGYAIYEGSK